MGRISAIKHIASMQRKGQTERVKVRSYLNFSRIICYTWVGRRRDEPSPRIGIELVINGNSSKVFQPGERALHNTSEWQHGEFLRRLVRTENNGKLRTELLAYGIGQFPSFVSAVRQHLFNRWKQPFILSITPSAPTLSWAFASWTTTANVLQSCPTWKSTCFFCFSTIKR